MAYQKTNWVNGYTPLNASNMNKIEEGIFNNDTFLSSLDIRVNTLEGSIGQGGIASVNISGNGNALNNASYDPSTKILNFEKNNSFALDSDLDSVNDKNLYHLGAYDSVSGNVITRQTGYQNVSKWFLQNANNLTFRSTGGGYQIGKDGGNGLLSNPYLVETLATGIANKDFIFADDNTCYGNSSNYILNPNWISLPNTFNTKQSYINYFSQNEIIIEYKLATPYTETIIEDRPLNTLDQSGSQWVREEWEKGLNLYYKNDYYFSAYGQTLVARGSYIALNGTNTKGSDNFLPFNPFSDLEVNKVYTLKLSTTTGFILECWLGGIQYKTNTNGLITINLTQEIKNGDWRIVARSNSSFNNTLINIMLVEGSHAYPYQQYQGKIVREKQLNDKLNFKIFDASNSTMNDVLDYIRQNYDHIISIIYYARSGGEAFGSNVIYNADEGILAYITSGLTFANVQLNTDAEEGSDYIIIYKQY